MKLIKSFIAFSIFATFQTQCFSGVITSLGKSAVGAAAPIAIAYLKYGDICGKMGRPNDDMAADCTCGQYASEADVLALESFYKRGLSNKVPKIFNPSDPHQHVILVGMDGTGNVNRGIMGDYSIGEGFDSNNKAFPIDGNLVAKGVSDLGTFMVGMPNYWVKGLGIGSVVGSQIYEAYGKRMEACAKANNVKVEGSRARHEQLARKK